MTPFRPLTVGYDWEMWLLEPTGEPVLEATLLDVAAALRRARPECPSDIDFRSLEIRSGPCRHADEMRERTEALLTLARREARRRRLLFLPSAGHPVYYNVLGAHVHAGSIYDLTLAGRLRAAIAPRLPALVALAAASPVMNERVGEFKSYRVAMRAHNCAVPVPLGDPDVLGMSWGEDACVKVAIKPTVEIRLFDTPIHPGLYVEMAVLAAGLVAGTFRRMGRRRVRLDAAAGKDYLENRLAAARHGLQATLRLDDELVPADRAVRDVLEVAADGMTELGLPPDELVWIPRLLAARTTQADFLLELYGRNPDPFAFVTDLATATADGRAFERWLDRAPRLSTLPRSRIGDSVLAAVNGDSGVRDANRWAALPPALLEREVRTLERERRLRRVEDPDRGLRFRRTPEGEGG